MFLLISCFTNLGLGSCRYCRYLIPDSIDMYYQDQVSEISVWDFLMGGIFSWGFFLKGVGAGDEG